MHLILLQKNRHNAKMLVAVFLFCRIPLPPSLHDCFIFHFKLPPCFSQVWPHLQCLLCFPSGKAQRYCDTVSSYLRLPQNCRLIQKNLGCKGKKAWKRGAEPSFPFEIGIQFVKKRSFFDKLNYYDIVS